MPTCEGCKKVVATGARTTVLMKEERCFGILNEESDGTTLGSWKRLALTSESIINEISTFQSEALNPQRSVTRRMSGSRAVGGDLNVELSGNGYGWIIAQAIGKVIGAGTSGDPYTIIPVDANGIASNATAGYQQDSALYESEEITYDESCCDCDGYERGYYTVDEYALEPGFTFWISRDGGTLQNESGVDFTDHGWFQYRGCKVNTWAITAGAEVITSVFGILGRDETIIDEAIPDYTEAPAANDPFSGFTADVEIDSISECVLSFEMTLNNNMASDQYCLGDQFRNSLPEGRKEITGTITLELTDLRFYNKFLEGTSAVFTMLMDLFDDGTETMKIILPKIEFNGTTPTVGGPDVINQELPFNAMWESSPADSLLVKGATATTPNGFDIAVEIVTASALV